MTAIICITIKTREISAAAGGAGGSGILMKGGLHLNPCAVHFYLNHDQKVEWDAWIRNYLARESALQAAVQLEVACFLSIELCCAPAETQEHIQCVCTSRSKARESPHTSGMGMMGAQGTCQGRRSSWQPHPPGCHQDLNSARAPPPGSGAGRQGTFWVGEVGQLAVRCGSAGAIAAVTERQVSAITAVTAWRSRRPRWPRRSLHQQGRQGRRRQ
jgi:hypothetical protein